MQCGLRGWSHPKGLINHMSGSSSGCRLGPHLAPIARTHTRELPRGLSFLIAWQLGSKGECPKVKDVAFTT